MSDSRRRGFVAVVFGVITIASVLLMHFKSGPAIPPHTASNEGGFRSSMLWFELALTPAEIFDNLGPITTTHGQDRRHQLDVANKYDFAFMVCYSLYNAALIYLVTHLNVYRLKSLLKLRVFLVLGLMLSAAMLIGDIVENLQLLALTQVQRVEDVQQTTLWNLIYWTRIKWGAIFIVCLMLSAGYASYFRRIPTLLLPAVYAAAGVSGLIAIFVTDARASMEFIAIPAVTIAWAASLLHAAAIAIKGPARFLLPEHLHARQTNAEA